MGGKIFQEKRVGCFDYVKPYKGKTIIISGMSSSKFQDYFRISLPKGKTMVP